MAAPRAKVITGEAHNGYWPYWTLLVPEGTTIREYRWDFHTDKQHLLDAARNGGLTCETA